MVALRGIEPTICRLKVYRPKPLDDKAIIVNLVGTVGVEPTTFGFEDHYSNPLSYVPII